MRRGFTMIEGVLSTIVVGVMMVAAVRVVAASRMVQYKNAAMVEGSLLAESLLAEIAGKPYEDTDSPVFGREGGEVGATRADLDDVDDYHGWSEAPPCEADGTPIPGLETWGREVRVDRVPASNLQVGSATETGAKRVTVKVTLRGATVETLVAVRTRAR